MIIKGYMVPHPPVVLPGVGRGEERKCGATVRAFRRMADEIAALKPELLIFLSPHAAMYRDWFDISDGTQAEDSFSAFRCPQVKLEAVYDTEWIGGSGKRSAGRVSGRNRLSPGTGTGSRHHGAAVVHPSAIQRIPHCENRSERSSFDGELCAWHADPASMRGNRQESGHHCQRRSVALPEEGRAAWVPSRRACL